MLRIPPDLVIQVDLVGRQLLQAANGGGGHLWEISFKERLGKTFYTVVTLETQMDTIEMQWSWRSLGGRF